jgi:hypothetical protein
VYETGAFSSGDFEEISTAIDITATVSQMRLFFLRLACCPA